MMMNEDDILPVNLSINKSNGTLNKRPTVKNEATLEKMDDSVGHDINNLSNPQTSPVDLTVMSRPDSICVISFTEEEFKTLIHFTQFSGSIRTRFRYSNYGDVILDKISNVSKEFTCGFTFTEHYITHDLKIGMIQGECLCGGWIKGFLCKFQDCIKIKFTSNNVSDTCIYRRGSQLNDKENEALYKQCGRKRKQVTAEVHDAKIKKLSTECQIRNTNSELELKKEITTDTRILDFVMPPPEISYSKLAIKMDPTENLHLRESQYINRFLNVQIRNQVLAQYREN